RAIAREVGREKYSNGAQALSADRRHCGAHAEPSRFIGGSAYYGAAAAPSDDYRFAAQLGIISLLDGRIECIHVDVDDFAFRRIVFLQRLRRVQLRPPAAEFTTSVRRQHEFGVLRS